MPDRQNAVEKITELQIIFLVEQQEFIANKKLISE